MILTANKFNDKVNTYHRLVLSKTLPKQVKNNCNNSVVGNSCWKVEKVECLEDIWEKKKMKKEKKKEKERKKQKIFQFLFSLYTFKVLWTYRIQCNSFLEFFTRKTKICLSFFAAKRFKKNKLVYFFLNFLHTVIRRSFIWFSKKLLFFF